MTLKILKTKTMPPTLTKDQRRHVEKLIAALRSGDYEQARSALRKKRGRGYAFCCLGVACDLYHKAHRGKFKWENEALLSQSEERSCSGFIDNEKIQDYFGFIHSGGFHVFAKGSDKGEGLLRNLAYLNDRGFTFEEIADFLEWLLTKAKDAVA